MDNITPLRAVKPVFSPVLALNAALNFEAETASKMAVAIVAALVTQTDDRSVVRVRYSDLARRLRVGSRCIEIHFSQLLASGLLTRPDSRVPFEYAWNVEALHTLAHAERPGVAKISLLITGLSWAAPDEQEILCALRDGYRRGYAKKTGTVKYAPRWPREEVCRELVGIVRSLSAEHGYFETEIARYLGHAYVRFDTGAWEKRGNEAPPWEWLRTSTVAEPRALRMLASTKDKIARRKAPPASSPAPVDPRALAAQAAQVARAAGMAGAR